MTSIWGTTQQYKPTKFVTSDKMLLTVGERGAVAEFLLQDVNIQSSRPVAELFEIGTSYTYFAPGRSRGSMSISRVVGAKRITDVLGEVGKGVWSTTIEEDEYQDASNRTITLKEIDETKTNPLTYKLTGAIVESYGMATSAQGLLIQETVSIRFADIQFGGNDTVAAALTAATGVATSASSLISAAAALGG